jgi:TonB family protein
MAFPQAASFAHPVDQDAARKHLLNHPDPVYPPIAKAARVQGTVEINVVIGIDGLIKEQHVLTGPPMLQQAALDALHKWTFRPFRISGKIVPVATTFEIPFQIDKAGEGPSKDQQEAAQAWFPLSDKCRNALREQNREESLKFCEEALNTSMKASDLTSSDQLVRVDSHQNYGHALLMAGMPQQALDQENKAIAEAKKCLTETDQEYAMPFFWRAMVEANLGQVDETFADFRIAEETYRRAIAHLPSMKKKYSEYLASILRQHAMFLDQLGRREEAEKLRAEAESQ